MRDRHFAKSGTVFRAGLRLGFRVRRSGIVPFHRCDGRGDAETEASETNRREGHAIDPPADLQARFVCAGSVGAAEAQQDDGIDLCAARTRSRTDGWPLPPRYDDDVAIERLVFRRVGRPPQDLDEPDWPVIAQEIKRKGVTLVLLWQEYRAAHPNGYGYTWFCDRFLAFQRRTHVSFRNRHEAGAVMQTD